MSQWLDTVRGELCTVVNHEGTWRDVPTRIPTGDLYYTQDESSIDVVICSRSAMEAEPRMVSIGSDTCLDTRFRGLCPEPPTRNCPDGCDCQLKAMSDHQLMVVRVKGRVAKVKHHRPDRWVWNLRYIVDDPAMQAKFASLVESRGVLKALTSDFDSSVEEVNSAMASELVSVAEVVVGKT